MFRTEIEEPKSSIQIDYTTQLVSLGSCFAQNIGHKLVEGKFQNCLNPLGISFNPISIFELIQRALLQDTDISDFHTKRDGLFYNFKLHSDFKQEDPAALDEQSLRGFDTLKEALEKTDLVILTFGTAWIYERIADESIVSNCHKRPTSEFKKRLLTIEEIISQFFEMKESLEKVNPKAQILLTVSPVRHTKETLEGNSVSKSILRTACHYLAEMTEDTQYYPAYEVMLDDLRDYRFYESDLIHPNEQGIQYIWDHFRKTFFNQNTETTYQKWSKLQRSMNHKPFNPKSKGHRKFLTKTLADIEQLSHKLDLKDEIKKLKTQLA